MALIREPRRAPWPYSYLIGGRGVLGGKMVKAGSGSVARGRYDLIATKVADMASVAPQTYEYGALSPLRERKQPYEQLQFGVGLRQQLAFDDRRYWQGECVDPSTWPWGKGPDIDMLTPSTRDSTSGVQEGFEFGGELYVPNGRYILKRVSDVSWIVVKDFGAGVRVLHVRLFTPNNSPSAVPTAFVALSGANKAQYSTNGTVWTQMSTFTATDFLQVGREWYIAKGNVLAKMDVDSDPTNEANYSFWSYRVGDQSSSIVSLGATAGGTLVAFKTDGIFTLDADGEERAMFPFLKFAPQTNNGRWLWSFGNELHATYNGTHFSLDSAFTLNPCGPERQGAPVQVTAGAAVGALFAHAGVWNPDTDTGYIFKYGAYASDQQENLTFVPAWNGSLSAAFPGKHVTSLWVSSVGAPDAFHTRTYFGLSDGTLGWFTNSCRPNPLECSQYRWTTSDGTLELPLFHGMFIADPKALRAVTVTGPLINATNTVQVSYRTDPVLPYIDFPTHFTRPMRDRENFPPNVAATLAGFRLTLRSIDTTTTPQIAALVIFHSLRAERVMEHSGIALGGPGRVKLDRTPYRRGLPEVEKLLVDAVDAVGVVELTLPDGSVELVGFLGFTEASTRGADGNLTKGYGWSAIQFETKTVFGDLARLRSYRLQDLRSFTLNQLRGL